MSETAPQICQRILKEQIDDKIDKKKAIDSLTKERMRKELALKLALGTCFDESRQQALLILETLPRSECHQILMDTIKSSESSFPSKIIGLLEYPQLRAVVASYGNMLLCTAVTYGQVDLVRHLLQIPAVIELEMQVLRKKYQNSAFFTSVSSNFDNGNEYVYGNSNSLFGRSRIIDNKSKILDILFDAYQKETKELSELCRQMIPDLAGVGQLTVLKKILDLPGILVNISGQESSVELLTRALKNAKEKKQLAVQKEFRERCASLRDLGIILPSELLEPLPTVAIKEAPKEPLLYAYEPKSESCEKSRTKAKNAKEENKSQGCTVEILVNHELMCGYCKTKDENEIQEIIKKEGVQVIPHYWIHRYDSFAPENNDFRRIWKLIAPAENDFALRRLERKLRDYAFLSAAPSSSRKHRDPSPITSSSNSKHEVQNPDNSTLRSRFKAKDTKDTKEESENEKFIEKIVSHEYMCRYCKTQDENEIRNIIEREGIKLVPNYTFSSLSSRSSDSSTKNNVLSWMLIVPASNKAALRNLESKMAEFGVLSAFTSMSRGMHQGPGPSTEHQSTEHQSTEHQRPNPCSEIIEQYELAKVYCCVL